MKGVFPEKKTLAKFLQFTSSVRDCIMKQRLQIYMDSI